MPSPYRRRPRFAAGCALVAVATALTGPAWADPAPSYEALLATADSRMYRDKSRRKQRVQIPAAATGTDGLPGGDAASLCKRHEDTIRRTRKNGKLPWLRPDARSAIPSIASMRAGKIPRSSPDRS